MNTLFADLRQRTASSAGLRRRAVHRYLVAALLLNATTQVSASDPELVKVGNDFKRTSGTLVSATAGDTACYLELKDAQGKAFTEMADFAVCEKATSLEGRSLALTYTLAKVMAEECQGDLGCKKSRTVPLVASVKLLSAAAPPAAKPTPRAGEGQASFCAPIETTVFSCRVGAKLVSVCSSRNLTHDSGFVQYRFGKPDSAEPLELMLPQDWIAAPRAATGQTLAFAGGGGAWLRFKKGTYSYTVYTGIGRWGPNGETREKTGVLVQQGTKRLGNLSCTGPVTSQLGPEWFDRSGVRAAGEDFDFPQ